MIVDSVDPITLVGGGQATPVDLHKALKQGPICVAADGGAALPFAENVPLAAVIGDMDSFDPVLAANLPKDVLHFIEEQDSTDFEKALGRISAPVVIGLGFTGGRIDHQLAAFHALLRFAHQPCVLLSQDEVVFLAPPHMALPTQSGDVVSLFPLVATAGESTGLRWPIKGLAFAPGQTIGTSNIAEGPVTLTFKAPGMLVILPRRCFGAVIQQFRAEHFARWPVRAA